MSEEAYRDPERLDKPSASGLEILTACPGSQNLKLSIPAELLANRNEEEDEWAKSGTRIHEAFCTGSTLNLDAEEAETYRKAVDNEARIVKKWAEDCGTKTYIEGPRELRVWLHDPNNFPDVIGSVKLDRHYLSRESGSVLVTDLKSGFDPNLPPSPRSWQLRCAAVALRQELYPGWMKKARVAYCKAQSFVTVNDYCDYTDADLDYAWQSLLVHLWEARQPDAPLHAGPHCNWCPCKPYCLAAGAYTMLPTLAARQAAPAIVPDDPVAMVQQMTPEDMARVWEVSTVTEKIIEAVKTRLKAMPADELAKVGLCLGKGRTLDPIVKIAEAWKLLRQHFSEDDILGCASLSKSQLAELAQKEKNMSKERAGKWLDAELDECIARVVSSPPLRRLKP